MSERETVRDDRPTARERVEEELLGEDLDLGREVARLSAMGEATRFTILYLLATDGETSSGELATLLDRRQNDLYHHLNKLEEAGLVGKYREGGDRVYELSPLAEAIVPQIFDSIRDRAVVA
ncbi:ArsR/SmtB family transcription factor [Halapricum salinum]|uniref:ArsR family transcriptional regulator n=1 Tax=Halapricum salinum TaxID=1457250 RepID=A0A4D6H9R6_9EURY|nr:metalloregulator ArsR/SmtB family transcription factor [Halapricum salinum]QCC50649.1 ArsR family transcriptional regulator [Halapricum salinum]